MFNDFIYLQGGLKISLLPLISYDIFSFVGFWVCFFFKTVAFEAECCSNEAVDGLSGDDGVKVDWVFKDVVSVGVYGKDVGGVTLPILKVGRPFAVKRVFWTVSKAPGSSQFLTVAISTLITAINTLLFTKVGIDWIVIVMSGLPLVLTEVIQEEWPALLLCANTCEYEWTGCEWERVAW